MKIKVSEATEVQLDWMVCKAAGMFAAYPKVGVGKKFLALHQGNSAKYIHPSTDWSQGGPIIEREFMDVEVTPMGAEKKAYDVWRAWHPSPDADAACECGPTPLIAAMRCYVASKLGDKVDVPEELT